MWTLRTRTFRIENKDKVTCVIQLPGLKKEDVDISLQE